MGNGKIVSEADEATQADEATEIALPPDGQVVFINDDYTTTDFVVSILKSIFHKSESEATSLMTQTHKTGRAVVGVYALDVALSRARQAMNCARKEGFPLQVKVLLLKAGNDE